MTTHRDFAPRGYFAIALVDPKTDANVGGVLRAAHCFGAAMVVIQGHRYGRSGTDTYATHKHIPLVRTTNVLDVIPFDCVPIAIEIRDDAKPLVTYPHPERAFYIFGPEDGSVHREIVDRCRDTLVIPSFGCLNLAATVNVVCYDRIAKQWARRARVAMDAGAVPA